MLRTAFSYFSSYHSHPDGAVLFDTSLFTIFEWDFIDSIVYAKIAIIITNQNMPYI